MKKNQTQKSESLKNKVLDILNDLQKIPLFKDNSILSEEINHMKNRTQDQVFKVAVVGEFSSGKSTFINALIQKDLLKHGAKETTATLTKIINVDREHPLHGKCKVVFRNGEEVLKYNLEEITAYTTTSSDKHLVSHEVESLEVYLHYLETSMPMMIIDTPGLNGMAENHREQTIELLKEAHACIYLIQLRGISQSDIDFIRFISSYQHDFIFLQNFIDELKELEDETLESKLKKQQEILDNSVFSEQKNVRYTLCGISSRQALLARDSTYDHQHEYGSGPLDEILRRKLLKTSNFEAVIGALDKLMKDNQKGLIQQRAVVEYLLQFLECGEELCKVEEENSDALWQNSDEARMLHKTTLVRDRLMEAKPEHMRKLDNFVHAKVQELSQFTKKKIEDDLLSVNQEIVGRVQELSSVEMLESYINNHELERYFGKKIPAVQLDYANYLEEGFQDILNNAVLRIQEYTGVENTIGQIPEFKVKTPEPLAMDFIQHEDNLTIVNKDIAKVISDRKSVDLEILKAQYNIHYEERRLETINEKTATIQKELELREQSLGRKPNKEKKPVVTRTYESHRKKHKYLGGLMDFVLGEKPVVSSEYAEDNRKQSQWNEKKRRLQIEYEQKMSELKMQKEEIESKVLEHQNKIYMMERVKEEKSKRLESLEKLYKSMKAKLEVEKQVAMKEYMDLVKKTVYTRIDEYLYERENIKGYFEEHAVQSAISNRKVIMKKVNTFYEATYEQKLKKYGEILQGVFRNDKVAFEQDIAQIKHYKKELEEYLCQIS